MTRHQDSIPEHVAHRPGQDGDRNDVRSAARGPSRRSLLKRLGTVGAVITTAGAGAVSVRAAANGVFTSGAGAPYDLGRDYEHLHGALGVVSAGILAASPHNMQNWLFSVTEQTIELYDDPTRSMPSVDPYGRERHIGLGCCLENMVLAARALGYAPRVELLPAPPRHVATVTLTEHAADPSPLYGAIGHRHTNRGPYRADEVSPSVLDTLSALNTDQADLGLRWFTDPGQKNTLGQLLVDAAQAVVADPEQSMDGFAWFRNDRSDIDRYRDGLTLDVQGVNAATLAAAKILPATTRTAGDQFWVQQTRTVHVPTAAAYGVVTCSDPHDPRLQLLGGRFLQRIHLSATTNGIALHHMNQITERIDREAEQRLPTTFTTRYADFLADLGNQPLATFRVGHPVRTARPSPRRVTADVLL